MTMTFGIDGLLAVPALRALIATVESVHSGGKKVYLEDVNGGI